MGDTGADVAAAAAAAKAELAAAKAENEMLLQQITRLCLHIEAELSSTLLYTFGSLWLLSVRLVATLHVRFAVTSRRARTETCTGALAL